MRKYLKHGKVPADVRDKDRWTATHWAAFNNHADVIWELKRHGANMRFILLC